MTAGQAQAELSPKTAQTAPRTTPPPLFSTDVPPAPDPALNKALEQMRGINVKTMEAVPPDFEEEDAPEESPIITHEGPSGKITYVERSEDSQLAVELVLDDQVTVFDAAFPAHQVDESVIVPLGKFAEVVGFPIKVDTSTGTAEGWFLKPENTFRFSSPYKFIEIAGKKIPLHQQGIAETHIDDIYVSLDLLNSWFPIGLTLNYGELRLYMKTLVDLPVQERTKRHGRWETSKLGQKQPGLEYDPKDVVKLPYRMYGAPALQVSHTYGHSMAADGSSTSTLNTTVNATSDLFGMSARYAAGFSGATAAPEEIQGLQFSLSKEDYSGGLLGPLKATQVELGDVSTGSFPLAGQGTGRGFTLSNQPYNFVSDASNFRITGFGTAGWDVEVFQGTELLAFTTVGDDGRYDFETLPLREGFNFFKVILYGPNGEREERYDRFYLGQSMVPKGEFYYNASALQSASPMFDVSASPAAKTPPVVSLMGEYGISKYVSASMGFFHGLTSGIMLDGVGLGLRTSGNSTYAQANAFVDKSGGKSLSGLVTGNITETATFNIRHQMHRGYALGVHSTLRSSAVQVTKLFDFKKDIIPDINFTLQAAREEEETGVVKMAYLNRLSTNFMGLNISNELERETFSDSTADNYTGVFSLRARTPAGVLHGELNYKYYQPYELVSGTVDLQNTLTSTLTLTTGMTHAFGTAPVTTLNSALDWKRDKVRLGLTGQISSTHSKQIGISMGYNLMPSTPQGGYTVAEITEDISAGRIIIRPFIDRNGDGVYNKGETIIKGIQFHNMLRGKTSESTKDGLAVLSGLTPNLANRITVEEKSVEDIFLTPRKKDLVVLGKTGVNGPVDFAFDRLGEISGTIVTVDKITGEEMPLNEVHMILLNKEGKEVADTDSESDGYFSFGSIPVGNYEVFFPASETLQQYYEGSGQGPSLSISFENPGLEDVKLKVEHNRILREGTISP